MLRRSSVVTEQPFDYRPGRTKRSPVSGLIGALDGIQVFLGEPGALEVGQTGGSEDNHEPRGGS